VTLDLLIADERSARLVYDAVGLFRSKSDSRSLLPGRYRARMLRLISPLVAASDPQQEVIRGLFKLAGTSHPLFNRKLECDDPFVSREAVSLLRLLHSPEQQKWRSTIEQVVAEMASEPLNIDSATMGVLYFIAGPVQSLQRGSMVLLKPPEAAAISAEAQVSLSSKSHSGASPGLGSSISGAVHNVVGNGIGSIVSGLCRSSASAGLVSSIDTKTGMCEIILMERDRQHIKRSGVSRTLGSRGPALTVRALRTPMTDIAMAQEFPLSLDDSFPANAIMERWLPQAISLLRKGYSGDSEGAQDAPNSTSLRARSAIAGNANVLFAIFVVRAATVILSDESILKHFLSADGASSTLGNMLALAATAESLNSREGQIELESLSSLPIHEGRQSLIFGMMKEVETRARLLEATTTETWTQRKKELLVRLKNKESAVDTSGNVAQGSGNTSGGGTDRPARTSTGTSARHVSRSSASSNSTEDEDESEAAATAAAHLREAAIAQMAELGLPRSWSELALRRTGGTNIEAAVHFCLERGGDMERLIAEERERDRVARGGSRRRGPRNDTPGSSHLLRQLLEMGFPRRWCEEALAASRNNVDEALTWILTNGERLSAEDEGMEEEEEANGGDQDDDDSVDDDDDEDDEASEDHQSDGSGHGPDQAGTSETNEAAVPATQEDVQVQEKPVADAEERTEKASEDEITNAWKGSVTPIRFISGRSIINPKNLAISGLPTGGFSSVGTKGVLLTSGKWYYEAILETAGCLQIGWADGSFSGHCHADRGDGCGDGPSSWAYDGWRRYRWHATATEWGCRWKEGDVVGCLVDMDEKKVAFTLNGRGEEIGMGTAFSGSGFRPCGGIYACVSFNRREKLRLILGGDGTEDFKHQPPPGYRGVGEAVFEAVKELGDLVQKESVLDAAVGDSTTPPRRFLCDFSDGEHGHELYAWQHRYYGNDASVHLGSGRGTKSSGSGSKLGSGGSGYDLSAPSVVSSLLVHEWSGCEVKEVNDEGEVDKLPDISVEKIDGSYRSLVSALASQLSAESSSLGFLYARKLVLQIVVSLRESFDLSHFVYEEPGSTEDVEITAALNFWSVLDSSVSLRSLGWGGEAGAMAIAAEALGLGISSAERAPIDRTRVPSSDLATTELSLPVAVVGLSQLLSTIVVGHTSSKVGPKETGRSLAACAEAAIGADGGGGPLVFLQKGLQSAAIRSPRFAEVLVAVIRRSIRLLAVVDYAGDDSQAVDSEEEELGGSSGNNEGGATGDGKEEDDNRLLQPDARLTCFLSGLLLSEPVRVHLSNTPWVMDSLFEAWSIGLLSASAPWRMVCSLTAAGIVTMSPKSLSVAVSNFPTLARFYSRLSSTVTRRVWAERAAVPVCSRYVQALTELLASVKRAVTVSPPICKFISSWDHVTVDAATPLPMDPTNLYTTKVGSLNWEWAEDWLLNDNGWDFFSGTVEYQPQHWTAPNRSAVRTLMDGGEGPPMLREGCHVLRGSDWEQDGSGATDKNEDGKDRYENEKATREREKKAHEEQAAAAESEDPAISPVPFEDEEGAGEGDDGHTSGEERDRSMTPTNTSKKKKRKKLSNPKLPVGTVVSMEAWNGIPALGRRVRWNLTGVEGVYRYGGDGGRFDLVHVEVNDKCTRVKKRHPLPESAEQCASRHGFGSRQKYAVSLRVKRTTLRTSGGGEEVREGIMELPDFASGILVHCHFHKDGSISIEEINLLYGAKDSGWDARFGRPSFRPGTKIVAAPTDLSTPKNQSSNDARSSFLSMFEEMKGSSDAEVSGLRNRSNGQKVRVRTEMTLLRERRCAEIDQEFSGFTPASSPPPIRFDKSFHAPSLSISRDGRTITCVAPDGRGSAFATTGFSRGAHYWEVKLEQADIGSVFIGVAEKPAGSGSGSSFGQETPRLNRWLGWGFVNFRATYTAGAERVYGAHCHNDDTVGVLLDCDAGRISFFYDGLKYGEHILNDLGCAFENLSPFGFNAAGCGSGGAGQGAPSGSDGGRAGRYPAHGAVRPRTLWPVIGLRNPGDRVTFSSKFLTSGGIDGTTRMRNVLAIDEVLSSYDAIKNKPDERTRVAGFPEWFVREAFDEYKRWHSGRWVRTVTRGSGPLELASSCLDVCLDCSPIACATACAGLGLKNVLLAGDRVAVKRSAGRQLELAEEAVILGAYQGRLFYRLVSQKSEGGSLTEGGGRAWFWDESEVVDDSLQVVGKCAAPNPELPLIDRFRCLSPGGLRIVYQGGAVVRSDLEIFDRSENMGSIPCDTLIPQKDVLERRVSSCGIVRYRIRYEAVGVGWISSRIRGGMEEPIIEPIEEQDAETTSQSERLSTPLEAALIWYKKNKEFVDKKTPDKQWEIASFQEFKTLIETSVPEGLDAATFDAFVSSLVGSITDNTEGGDSVECSFRETQQPIQFAVSSAANEKLLSATSSTPAANQAVAAVVAESGIRLQGTRSLLARIALLRALNRRCRYSLPWVCVRPSQEGSAILGGLCGHGAPVRRAGLSRLAESKELWVEVPSIATRLRNNRGILFSSVKRLLLDSIIGATMSPTPLSHDEYELPREIRTVRVNRLKARRAMSGSDNRIKRKHSVFSQLLNETRSWGGAALRRGFVAKGHGGQKRAFKVKLVGEGVNDYSGPYREVFTDALGEVMEHDQDGGGDLGVLDATPNNSSQIGDNRELFMFSMGDGKRTSIVDEHVGQDNVALSGDEARIQKCFAIFTMGRDESTREVEESLVFLGRLVGTACRHGIPVDLPLPMDSVWKAIVEERTEELASLREMDLLASRHESRKSTNTLLLWQQRMLKSFLEGMSHVIPVEVMGLLTGEELRDMLCGNPDVDVDLLKRVVEYEGYDGSEAAVEFFWEALREMSLAQRKKFLQFVWARSRLPKRESDFEAPFKLVKDAGGGSNDAALPAASTCFFSLTLPEYSSKDILKEKLLFAIENVCTMESDYVTNDAEVGEGWRGL